MRFLNEVCVMKRIIMAVSIFALFTLVPVFESTPGIPLTVEQKMVEDAGFTVNWIDPGIEYISIRHEGQRDGSEELYWIEVVTENGSKKYGFVNGRGQVAVPVIYDDAQPYSNGVTIVRLNGKRIVIDTNGEEVFDVSEYDRVNIFSKEFADTYINGKWGVIDKSGNEVLPCEYDSVGWSKHGAIWAGKGELIFTDDGELEQDNRKYALFDSAGKRLTEFEYEYIGLANWREKWWDYLETDETEPLLAKKDGKYGFIDNTGKIVIPCEYEAAFGGTEGIFACSKNGKWGHIDSEGKITTPFLYDDAEAFGDGLANVNKDGKWGYVDTRGNLVIPCEYESEGYFLNGAAAVTKTEDGGIHGYVIDKTGNAIVGPKDYNMYVGINLYEVEPFESTGRPGAILDKEGNRLTRFYPMSIGSFNDGIAQIYFTVNFKLLCGLINQYGAEISPPIFSDIKIIDSGKCIVGVSDNRGLDGRIGVLSLPPDAATRKPPLSEKPITVYLDGLDLYFDVEPKIIDGRTMVPMRKIFEALGADISWDGDGYERKVTAARGSITVELTIGNDTAFINEEPIKLDSPAIIENSRTLVPIRFVAESLGCDVSWEAENRRVTITSGIAP